MIKARPSQGKNLHEGVYGTPLEFLSAVDAVFPIFFDLAADSKNQVGNKLDLDRDGKPMRFFNEETDSLKQDWASLCKYRLDFLWLNPPFDHIALWAKKCAEEAAKGARVILFVPQGTQKWNLDFCQRNSLELRLDGRMKFDGHDFVYPKDMSIFIFGIGIVGSAIWSWRD